MMINNIETKKIIAIDNGEGMQVRFYRGRKTWRRIRFEGKMPVSDSNVKTEELISEVELMGWPVTVAK